MKLKSFPPVIATKGVTEARDFYVRYFGFKVVFDAGWYVQLHGERDGGGAPLELAFMLPDHESLPPALRRAFDGQGMFLTVEVEDVDTLYERLRGDGHEILIELRFGVRDPNGGMLDVVKPIPPSAEYQAGYLQSESDPDAR